uniref:Alliinase EGF-like domain-containing protein n=1 Tax=Glycine max TaxID=3847 RepID=K7MHN0_SOYBN
MAKKTSAMNLAFILILLCASNVFVCRGEWEPTWSSRAAEEAEAVAAIPCSGHGRVYLDGLILKGHEPVCECNPCYGGSDCSKLLSDCAANAAGWVAPHVLLYDMFDICLNYHSCEWDYLSEDSEA